MLIVFVIQISTNEVNNFLRITTCNYMFSKLIIKQQKAFSKFSEKALVFTYKVNYLHFIKDRMH